MVYCGNIPLSLFQEFQSKQRCSFIEYDKKRRVRRGKTARWVLNLKCNGKLLGGSLSSRRAHAGQDAEVGVLGFLCFSNKWLSTTSVGEFSFPLCLYFYVLVFFPSIKVILLYFLLYFLQLPRNKASLSLPTQTHKCTHTLVLGF